MKVISFDGPGWAVEEKQAALAHADGAGYDWILTRGNPIPLMPYFYHATQRGWKGCFCAVSLERLLARIDEAVMNFEGSGVWAIAVTLEGRSAQVFPSRGVSAMGAATMNTTACLVICCKCFHRGRLTECRECGHRICTSCKAFERRGTNRKRAIQKRKPKPPSVEQIFIDQVMTPALEAIGRAVQEEVDKALGKAQAKESKPLKDGKDIEAEWKWVN